MTFQPLADAVVASSYSVSLRQSDNLRHLVRHAAPLEPFFLLGDTAWELFHKLDEAEALVYLRNRAAKGFNFIMIVLLAENDGLVEPNRYGHLPLLGDTPDPKQPSPEYFAFVDRVIALASGMGMTVALVPSWGRYITGGLAGGPVIFNEQNAFEYARFLGERYPFQPFILGGDTNRFWNERAVELLGKGAHPDGIELTDYRPVVEAMVKGIEEGVVAAKTRYQAALPAPALGYRPFITYHSTQGWLGEVPAMASAQFPDADWLSLDCVQSGHLDIHPLPHMQQHTWQGTSSYGPVRTMFEKNKRCVIDLEGHYEATHHAFDPKQEIWRAADIRNGGYQAIFAGACGYVYGCNSIWQMYTPSDQKNGLPIPTAYTEWFYELDLPGAFHAGIMRRVILSLPNCESRRPDQTLILSDTHDTGDGLAGDKLISAMIGDGWTMVHLPYGGEVKVDMAKACPLDKGWRAWWIDPKDGSRRLATAGEKLPKRRSPTGREFVAPSGGSKENDWLLLVEQVWELATAI